MDRHRMWWLGVLVWLIAGLAGPLAAGEGFVCAGYLPPAWPGPAGAAKPTASRLPSQGHLQVLVVFAGFPDEVASQPQPPSFAAALLDPEQPGSFAHFYRTMSSGQLELGGRVLPRRYASAHPVSAYLPANPDRRGEYGRFVEEVLRRADADVDFGQFDNDGPDGQPNSGDDDGVVDYAFVILHSVPRGLIYKGANGVAGLAFSDPIATQDLTPAKKPVVVSNAVCLGALIEEGTFSQTAGIMAHEFGHALGLPDLYDLQYDGPADDSGGVGRWDLMGWGAHGWTGDDGPNTFGPAGLEQLGWIGRDNQRLVELTEGQRGLLVRDLFQGGQVYKIPLPPRLVQGQGRAPEHLEAGYLLLEQRRRASHYYNRHLPAEGVLLWRVQPNTANNNDEQSKRVDLICADGLYDEAGYPSGRSPDAAQGQDNLDFWSHDDLYAQAHAGNLGDPTDPFDGLRYTEFSDRTNPAIASAGEFSSAALQPLRLRFHPQGEAMVVDAELPRWSGVIREEVHWSGDVLVDGDLEVAPEGAVVVYPGTRVRFAPADRRHSGVDPQRCEFEIRGSLRILPQATLLLAGQQPGESWYGVLFAPGTGARVEVPEGSLDIRDASRGLVMPGAPPGAHGLTLSRDRLFDLPSGETAGNGDGQLQPGESFRLAVDLTNWSLSNYKAVKASFTWKNALFHPTWTDLASRFNAPDFSMQPGEHHPLELPVLTLDPQAQPGEQVELQVHLVAGSQSWTRIDTFVVRPAPPLPELDLEVAGQPWGAQPVLASREESLPVRALVRQGETKAVDLVVRRLPGGEVVEELPLRPRDSSNLTFETLFQAPDLGQYELILRPHRKGGGTGFGAQRSQVVAPFDAWGQFLVLMPPRSSKGATDKQLQGLFEQVLATRHETANFLVPTAETSKWVDPLLARYLDKGGGVIWASGSLNQGIQEGLVRYLDDGGRLLISTSGSLSTWSKSLKGRLPLDALYAGKPSPLAGQGALASLKFAATHLLVKNLRAPAQPLLLDAEGQAAGLLMDAGSSRLVYLPFDLSGVESAAQPPLVDGLLELLRPRSPLLIEQVNGAGPLADQGPLRPSLVLANTGAQPTQPFLVVCQVRQGDQVIARLERLEPPLKPEARREVALPAWSPPAEADYGLEFSLVSRAETDTLYSASRPLQVAQVQGRFEPAPGIADTLGNGAALIDYDNDGDLDLAVVRRGAANRLYRNDGGEFSEQAAQAGLDRLGMGRGLAVGDYDGDGDLDLYLVEEGPNHFFRNEGDGTFSDQSAALDAVPGTDRPLADAGSGRSAAFFDGDLDGDLDLFLVDSGSPNRLFRNDGGRFTEVAAEWGLAETHSGRGLAVGDYDSDGDPDLFVASLEPGSSRLFRNDGGRFADATAALGLQPPRAAVAGVFGDCDDDGDLDLFVSSQDTANALWRNDGPAGFQRVAEDLGRYSAGAAFLDYDDDGDLDLAVTSVEAKGGDELYHNRGRSGFVAVGAALGLRPASDGRGISAGDYDQDGRLDLLVADNRHTVLYRNAVVAAGWLALELADLGANRFGVGARVALNAGGRRQVREVQSGYGYGSQVQPALHFGLGAARLVDSVRVFWPDGTQTRHILIRADQRLRLSQHQMKALAPAAPPPVFSLEPNYPNPFNLQTAIPYQLPGPALVELAVFNPAGQLVRRLVHQSQEAGPHQALWDGRDESGRPVASGVYFGCLRAGAHQQVRRLLLLK